MRNRRRLSLVIVLFGVLSTLSPMVGYPDPPGEGSNGHCYEQNPDGSWTEVDLSSNGLLRHHWCDGNPHYCADPFLEGDDACVQETINGDCNGGTATGAIWTTFIEIATCEYRWYEILDAHYCDWCEHRLQCARGTGYWSEEDCQGQTANSCAVWKHEGGNKCVVNP